MTIIENLSDITLDFDRLQKHLHNVKAVSLALIDFEGVVTPRDSQEEYLIEHGKKVGFDRSKAALRVLGKEIRQSYLKRRVRAGRWVSPLYESDPTEIFYNRFLLKRPAKKTIEEMRDVGNKLPIGPGVVKTFKKLKKQRIRTGIISGTLLSFLEGFMKKSRMKKLQPIPLYAVDVNVEDGLIAELQTKPYMHSQKITVMDNLIAYDQYGEGEVGVVDDGVSGIELFKAQKRTYRPIAFNPSDHLLKEISMEDSLGCYVVISDNFTSVLPLLLGEKALEFPGVKRTCEKSKYFEKRPGTVWDDFITGLGSYSPETGRPEKFIIDRSVYRYRQDAVSRYKKGNSLAF